MRARAPLTTRITGKKVLTGYFPGLRHPTDPEAMGYGFEFEDISVIFYENPDDGYRSSCEAPLFTESSLSGLTHYKASCVRLNAEVRVKHVLTHNRDVYEITDIKTKKVVAVVGTENTDDYYPFFTIEWHPQNFHAPVREIV